MAAQNETTHWPELFAELDEVALKLNGLLMDEFRANPFKDRRPEWYNLIKAALEAELELISHGSSKIRGHKVTILAGRSLLRLKARVAYRMSFEDVDVDLSGTTGIVTLANRMRMVTTHDGYGLLVRITSAPDPALVGQEFMVRAIDFSLQIGEIG